MISDYHIHSKFSGDSNEELERIIERAKQLHLQEIAITDHMELGTGNQNFILDLEGYLKKLRIIKEREKSLKIKIGMEVGIQRNLGNDYQKMIQENDFDFIISSLHTMRGLDFAFPEFWNGRDRDEAHREYFEEVFKCLDIYDNYSIIGHLDFISRYGGEGKRGYIDYSKHWDIIESILKKIIEKGKGIEINTSGIRYNENRFYPCNDIVAEYFRLGGEIITIGSDAHKAEDIGKDFNKAYEYLKSIGVKFVSSFDNLEVTFKKIP